MGIAIRSLVFLALLFLFTYLTSLLWPGPRIDLPPWLLLLVVVVAYVAVVFWLPKKR